jgi:hypothetical protein
MAQVRCLYVGTKGLYNLGCLRALCLGFLVLAKTHQHSAEGSLA